MHPPTPPDTPLAQFFQLVPDGLPPRRADKSVGGVIPARALRYCEAITSASAFGWYVFLPMNFKVVWDGHDMLWTYPGVDEWLPLTRDAVQYPGFRERFDRHAPADVRGFSPPFLSPSNLSKSPSYQMLEGIIETDTWFGPLFDNVRLLKTDVPIEFRADVPFLQVQPVRKEFYADKFLQNFSVKSLDELSPENWEAFHRTVVVPNTTPERKHGQYAVAVRKQAAHAARLEPVSE
jgi:hypothetical protein